MQLVAPEPSPHHARPPEGIARLGTALGSSLLTPVSRAPGGKRLLVIAARALVWHPPNPIRKRRTKTKTSWKRTQGSSRSAGTARRALSHTSTTPVNSAGQPPPSGPPPDWDRLASGWMGPPQDGWARLETDRRVSGLDQARLGAARRLLTC